MYFARDVGVRLQWAELCVYGGGDGLFSLRELQGLNLEVAELEAELCV